MYCPYCGVELPDGAAYCKKCGKRLPTINSGTMPNESVDKTGVKAEVADTGAQTDSIQTVIDDVQVRNESLEKDVGNFPVNNTPTPSNRGNPQSSTAPSPGSAKRAFLIILGIAIVIAIIVTGIIFIGSSGSYESTDEKTAEAIANAIQPNDPAVKLLASSAIKNSAGDQRISQICDIYDYLYKNWTNTSTSKKNGQYTPAGESAVLMKGDTDDFAILMASCIKAIGGSARVIVADGGNGKRVYSEVYIAQDKPKTDIILNSVSRYNGAALNYIITSNSGCWLNLDRTANHPGGEFFRNVGDLLVVYPYGAYERESLEWE